MSFYQKYVELCAGINKSPSAVALENGFSKASVNHWKIGKASPSDITLAKFANYFGVSVDYLKGNTEEPEQKEKAATVSDGDLSDSEKQIIELWRSFSPAEQSLALKMLSALQE